MLSSRLVFVVFAALLVLTALTAQANPINVARSKQKALAKPQKFTSPSATFCSSFRASCIKAAVAGKKSGKVQIQESCQRNGGKYSTSYSFHCSAGGKDLTSKVLKNIGDGYTLTVTKGATVIATGTSIVATVTNYATYTSDVTQTATATVSSTTVTSTTATATATSLSTQTLTTVIPVTATSVSTVTQVDTVPYTTTLYTSVTQTAFGSEFIPLQQVVIGPSANGKRYNNVGSSSFCSSFAAACPRECRKVGSTPKHTICSAKSANHYSLACVCRNGKTETQHALADTLNELHYTTVTSVSTSTTYVPVTVTTVVPTTIYPTVTTTTTAVVPVTSTYISSTTLTTSSVVTEFTGLSVVVATATSTFTAATQTSSVLAATTISTSTFTVLLPTGVVNAIDAGNGQNYGGLTDTGAFYGFALTSSTAGSTPIVWAAIEDPTSGLYTLQTLDGTSMWFSADPQGGPLGQGVDTYLDNDRTTPGSCGTSAGPPVNGCEHYVFSPSGSTSPYNFNGVWFNADGGRIDTPWVLYTAANPYNVLQVSSVSDFRNTYDTNAIQVRLTFPN